MKEVEEYGLIRLKWECEHCGKQFEHYEVCESHEDNCLKNPDVKSIIDIFKKGEYIILKNNDVAFVKAFIFGSDVDFRAHYFVPWLRDCFQTQLMIPGGLKNCKVITQEEFKKRTNEQLNEFTRRMERMKND